MADYEYLVEVKDLQMHFPVKTGFFKTTPLNNQERILCILFFYAEATLKHKCNDR